MRLHVCWGNYEGPHLFDVALEEILPAVLEARVGGLVLSMANPRHAHEHRVLARWGYPKGWLLLVGAIDTTTNYLGEVAEEVVWEKLRSLRAGADLATRRLLE